MMSSARRARGQTLQDDANPLHSEACNALGASDGVIHSSISHEVVSSRATANINAVWHGVVWWMECGLAWCGVMLCGVMLFGVVRCGAVETQECTALLQWINVAI